MKLDLNRKRQILTSLLNHIDDDRFVLELYNQLNYLIDEKGINPDISEKMFDIYIYLFKK